MAETQPQLPIPIGPPEQPGAQIIGLEHSQLIQDKDKAVTEAYASKAAEVAAVEANARALEATSRLGEGRRLSNITAKHDISKNFKLAAKQRAIANGQADKAGEVYDMLKGTSGSAPEGLAEDEIPETYIQDKEKAVTVAYASKKAEEAALKARTLGLDAALNLDDKNWDSKKAAGEKTPTPITNKERAVSIGKKVLRVDQGRSAKSEVSHQLKAAQEARKLADEQAAMAGSIYDRFDRPINANSDDEDPRRGEVVAKATRAQIARATRARDLGIEAASNLGDDEWQSDKKRSAKRETKRQLRTFEKSLATADKNSAIAREVFDRHERFRTRSR